MNSRRRGGLLLALLALTAPWTGCAWIGAGKRGYPPTAIAEIYRAPSTNPERNPVILIHGFGGAVMKRRSDGARVWGAVFTKDSLGPSHAEGFRAFALDLDALPARPQQADLAWVDDDADAVELLERFHTKVGFKQFNVGVYDTLVETIEEAGYATCRSVASGSDPANEAPDCFTFFYDWRQDNVTNAIALGSFIEEARQQVLVRRGGGPVKFDVIAHSAGGLIARYYLRYGATDVLEDPEPPVTWAGARDIDRLVLVSTPNFGTMKALRNMVRGRNYSVVDFPASMIVSWVALYQLFPRADHAVWVDESGRLDELDVMSAATWRANGWGAFQPGQERFLELLLPDVETHEAREERVAAFMDAAFERARRFQAALDRHPASVSPTPIILFAGDATPTLEKARIRQRDGRLTLEFEGSDAELMAPGDGAVTRTSALADERTALGQSGWMRTPISWQSVFFISDRHRAFLGNAAFRNNLLHLLLDTPPPSRLEDAVDATASVQPQAAPTLE